MATASIYIHKEEINYFTLLPYLAMYAPLSKVIEISNFSKSNFQNQISLNIQLFLDMEM